MVLNAKSGSIIVFHDSAKAFPLLEYCLPRALDYLSGRGFGFERLVNPRVPVKHREDNIAL